MELTSRPLLATQRDQALFAGRTWERDEISRDLKRGFNIMVEGDRGSGKTSLLRSLMWLHHTDEQRDKGTQVYVRAAGLTDVAAVLNRVLDVLEGRDTPPERLQGAAATIRELAARQELGPVCVLLDDVDPHVGNQLFGVLRDELWETGVQWVVTVNTSDSQTLRTPPADAFFETVMRLTPLSVQEAADLLKRRLGPQRVNGRLVGKPKDVLLALAAGGGQPRELIERARHVDENSDPASILAAGNEIRSILAGLSRPANMLYAEIRHRDPISASDEDVQQLMGWTRSRLTQVLGELEQAGLLEAAEQARTGPGRPKKIFRVLSPFERRHLAQADIQSQGG